MQKFSNIFPKINTIKYQGQKDQLGFPIALKLSKVSVTKDSKKFSQQFSQVSQLLASLNYNWSFNMKLIGY